MQILISPAPKSLQYLNFFLFFNFYSIKATGRYVAQVDDAISIII